MVGVTIICLRLFLILGALGELWSEIQSLFPHSLDFHVVILHYEAIIGAQYSFVCRIGLHMLINAGCSFVLEKLSTHSSTISSMNGYKSD